MNANNPDFYLANAEWYAALIRPGLPAWRNALAKFLPHPIPSGIAVDIGAGVGATLDAFLPTKATQIYAIEPSAMMRVGLMTRIALHEQLAPITTVLPGTYAETQRHLPNTIGAVCALNMWGHLSPAEEQQLWHDLARRLVPGARVLIALQPPETPTQIAPTDFGTTAIGDHRFRTSGSCRPRGADSVEWEMHWELQDALGNTVDHRTSVTPWRTISAAQLEQQARAVGLVPVGVVSELCLSVFEVPEASS